MSMPGAYGDDRESYEEAGAEVADNAYLRLVLSMSVSAFLLTILAFAPLITMTVMAFLTLAFGDDGSVRIVAGAVILGQLGWLNRKRPARTPRGVKLPERSASERFRDAAHVTMRLAPFAVATELGLAVVGMPSPWRWIVAGALWIATPVLSASTLMDATAARLSALSSFGKGPFSGPEV